MTTEILMLVTWGVCTAAFLGLLAYNATLNMHGDDQLFLHAHDPRAEERQTKMVRHVNRTTPILRVFGGVSAVLGACLIGMYTWQAWMRIHS